MTIDVLRATPLFAGLDEADLERLAATTEPMRVPAGDLLITEGDPGDSMFIVTAGELEVTKRAGTSELPLARVGPGAIQGEMAAIEGRPRTASVRALTDAEVIRIPREGLLALLDSGPDAAIALLRTVLERLRSTESMLRQREKLAGLGTLAAGLAHELNNPSAAIRRSVSLLAEAIASRDQIHPPHDLLGIHPSPDPPALDALARADAVDEIADLVGGDSETAAALVDAGWSADQLRVAFAGMDSDTARDSAAWLAASAKIDAILSEVGMAGERISEIVGAVKSYAYLDQAPVQRIDVKAGIDNTLVILRSKLKAGIDVTRHYAPDLPEIEAYGSELNQVWTNLIDNAADAMDGRGAIDIYVNPVDGGIGVRICDTGPGIPPNVLPHLFEPFFTTKAPGVGTGLGLHISHSVVARHGGRIEVESKPGDTCFSVTLPRTLPPSPAAAESEREAEEEAREAETPRDV